VFTVSLEKFNSVLELFVFARPINIKSVEIFHSGIMAGVLAILFERTMVRSFPFRIIESLTCFIDATGSGRKTRKINRISDVTCIRA
jgi:hypothetical protein